jgi:type II secretory ATPase GspE/PulE/Tfp pilus assembly ATPase PilB-like protein
MPSTLGATFRQRLAGLDAASSRFVTEVVDGLLNEARSAGVSDVHLAPASEGVDVRWRVDGVLHFIATLPASIAPNIVARLKVMADLLTYKTDIPQEGRIRSNIGDVEMRVSTFPTLFGEKAVVRLFAGTGQFERLNQLGLPAEVSSALMRLLEETSGAVLFTGPAGSGKTTTIYACLRELVALTEGRRSLTSLEDPIEVPVPGVSQSQVNLAAGFNLETGLRSLMRQDPEVIAVGEIRDRATAEVAFQASLTGHLVMTTFHSGSAAGALGRLLDMGIEPYILRSGVLAVVFQRLVRRLCTCARHDDDPKSPLGLPVVSARAPIGCDACGGTGFHGRAVLAEILYPDRPEVARAILTRADVDQLEAAAVQSGMVTRWQRGVQAIDEGVTAPREVRRVLGFSGRGFDET